jgi:predicted HNH restriction endonuclease
MRMDNMAAMYNINKRSEAKNVKENKKIIKKMLATKNNVLMKGKIKIKRDLQLPPGNLNAYLLWNSSVHTKNKEFTSLTPQEKKYCKPCSLQQTRKMICHLHLLLVEFQYNNNIYDDFIVIKGNPSCK